MKNIRENVDEKVFPYISTNRRNNRDYLKSAYPAFTELLDTFQKNIPKEIFDGNARLLKKNWENYIVNIVSVENKIKTITDLYDQTRRKYLAKYYQNIAICPYCGLNEPDTLDHFLPKKKHPLLSITLYNLIPCCNNCNHKKKEYDSSVESISFFNPYLDEGNSNWLKIEAISITNQSLDISYAFNEAAFDSENQRDVFKVTCKELDLLPRYACRSIEFILNQKKNIQKFCTKQTEVGNYFEIMLKQLPQDDFWKTQLCRYIAENETAQEIIFKYCNIANRWFFCKNSMRGPGYKESLDNYLNFVGNNEKRYIFSFRRRI